MLRLPLNEAMRSYAGELLRTVLAVLAADGEEAGQIALRTSFEIHKTFRTHMEEHVPLFLDIVRKVRSPRSFHFVYAAFFCQPLVYSSSRPCGTAMQPREHK